MGFMVKEENEENRGSVEFQVFSFTNKIRRLASHLEFQSSATTENVPEVATMLIAPMSTKSCIHGNQSIY